MKYLRTFISIILPYIKHEGPEFFVIKLCSQNMHQDQAKSHHISPKRTALQPLRPSGLPTHFGHTISITFLEKKSQDNAKRRRRSFYVSNNPTGKPAAAALRSRAPWHHFPIGVCVCSQSCHLNHSLFLNLGMRLPDEVDRNPHSR